MKTIYSFLAIFLLSIITGCDHHPLKTGKAKTVVAIYAQHKFAALDSAKNDSVAVARIEKLPEYKHIVTWFNRTNKDTSHHIAILTEAMPTKEANYYQLQLGVDGPERFEDMELFYVDAKTFVVQHIDKETDNATTVAQWRKSGTDKWLK